MKREQYVMAYGVEQDRLRAVIPDGFTSIRPVLRINAEIIDENRSYIEFNTPIGRDGKKGWLNIACWNDIPFEKKGREVIFRADFLEISFTYTGIEGACPAEKDNDGCYFIGGKMLLRSPETITAGKEFCDCRFKWKFTEEDAEGVSIGKTLPAHHEEIKKIYAREAFTAENAAKIPCRQVLGAYAVKFDR